MVYDFIIIGGGIVGLSVAMQLSKKMSGVKIALLEKESELAFHQTGHNSGVIHAGVYYSPGSLKANFCFQGNQAIKSFCQEHDIKTDICGKIIVATNELELEGLKRLQERSKANRLESVYLDSSGLKDMEPNISGLSGLFFPSSGIVGYAQVAKHMGKEFVKNGGEIFCSTEVVGLCEHSRGMIVKTKDRQFESNYLISCAGLQSDRIVKMLGIKPNFTICPFRGEYYLLNSIHNNIVKHLIYPVPDPSVPFLGVHLTKMIDGSVTVGPNAVLGLKREGYDKSDISFSDIYDLVKHRGVRKVIYKNLKHGLVEMKNSLYKRGYLDTVRKYCPSLNLEDLLPYPCGIRAQAISDDGDLVEDFLFVNTQKAVIVCNAPSPGATSSIPIGAYILENVDKILKDDKYL